MNKSSLLKRLTPYSNISTDFNVNIIIIEIQTRFDALIGTIYRVTQNMNCMVSEPKSVLEVRFDFSTCVLESKFRACLI